MHRVAVLALDGVIPFDLATPCEVFGRARHSRGRPAYEVRVCAAGKSADAGAFALQTRWGLRALRRADTVIVPGVASLDRPVPGTALRAIQAAARSGARVASICTGAFVLAATGLLDGLCVTTHWAAASELARRYPTVRVDADVLYTDHQTPMGRVLTSAGAAAGLDLCLHLVRMDFGQGVAAQTARVSVMPLERAGGQAQFIVHEVPAAESGAVQRVQQWIVANLHRPISLRDMAQNSAMSERSLSRHFRAQTGTTPMQWLLAARARRAQELLESTEHSIERVAALSGFASAANLRDRFARVVGTTPSSYRRSFRARPQPRG